MTRTARTNRTACPSADYDLELLDLSALMSSRQATHAGSWYSDDVAVLKEKLESYILRTKPADHKVHGARIIISPHAGYSYSGPTAAYGFKALDLSHVCVSDTLQS